MQVSYICENSSLIEDFLAYLTAERGLEQSSQQEYHYDLTLFDKFLATYGQEEGEGKGGGEGDDGDIADDRVTEDASNTGHNTAVNTGQREAMGVKIASHEFCLQHIKDYIHSLFFYQANTIARKISSLKHFFKFLHSEKYTTQDFSCNIESIKQPAWQPKFFNHQLLKEFIRHVEFTYAKTGRWKDLRNLLLIKLASEAGLRASEVVSLKYSAFKKLTPSIAELQPQNLQSDNIDIAGKPCGASKPSRFINKANEANRTNKQIFYLQFKGKAGKERIVPLKDGMKQIYEEYVKLTFNKIDSYNKATSNSKNNSNNKGDDSKGSKGNNKSKGSSNDKSKEKNNNYDAVFLFPSNISHTNHLTRQAFWKIVKKIALEIGIDEKYIHPHILRHQFATNMLAKGLDIRILQEVLGHSSISTTQVYTHLEDKNLKEKIAKNHPLNKLNY